jgi:hypothetical protein
MFYTNRQVTKVSMKDIALKAKSELLVTLSGNKNRDFYRVLNNDEGVLVIQDVNCAYIVYVLDNSVEVLYRGDKDIKCGVNAITTSCGVPITLNADCTKFVYQKEVTSTVWEDDLIAIGDDFDGYLGGGLDDFTVVAVSGTQLVLNCWDTNTQTPIFAILDKNTLNSDGDWNISLGQGKRLTIDSDTIKWVA